MHLPTAATRHVRHRRVLALHAEPHPRGRPHLRRGARPAPPRRLGRPAGVGSRARRRPRLRRASSHPPARRSAGSRSSGRPRSAGSRQAATSSTSGRTATAGSVSTTSVRRAPSSRSPTASGSTPTATSPRSTSPSPRRPASSGPSRSRPTWSSQRRRDGDVFEPRHSTKGFQYVRIDGHPGPSPPRSPASSSTPISPASAASSAPTSASTASTRRRVELPRQRLRHPHRLPHARALRMDRRLADLRRDRRVPLRRHRLLREVAARPRSRAATRRRGHQHRSRSQPGDDGRRPSGRTSRAPPGWGDAAVHVPWELYRATGRTDVLADQFDSMQALGRLRGGAAATGRHPVPGRAHRRPAPHERTCGTAAGTSASGSNPAELDGHSCAALRRRPRPGRHRLPLPFRRRSSP